MGISEGTSTFKVVISILVQQKQRCCRELKLENYNFAFNSEHGVLAAKEAKLLLQPIFAVPSFFN